MSAVEEKLKDEGKTCQEEKGSTEQSNEKASAVDTSSDWKDIIGNVVSDVAKIIGNYPERIVEIEKKVQATIKDILEGIDKLQEFQNNQEGGVRRLIYDFVDTTTDAEAFMEKIDDFARLCADNKNMQRITTAMQANDFRSLKDLLHKMAKRLHAATSVCENISKDCHKRQDDVTAAAEECNNKVDEAERKKFYKQLGGGIGSGLALAGAGGATAVAAGVLGSVALGFFTFGIGTIVGLTATAGGAAVTLAATGVGGAVATGFAAQRLDKVVTGLIKLKEYYIAIGDASTEMMAVVKLLNIKVNTAENAIDDLKRECEEKVVDSMSFTLNHLCETCNRMLPRIAQSKESLRKLNEHSTQLRTALNSKSQKK